MNSCWRQLRNCSVGSDGSDGSTGSTTSTTTAVNLAPLPLPPSPPSSSLPFPLLHGYIRLHMAWTLFFPALPCSFPALPCSPLLSPLPPPLPSSPPSNYSLAHVVGASTVTLRPSTHHTTLFIEVFFVCVCVCVYCTVLYIIYITASYSSIAQHHPGPLLGVAA